MKDRIVMITGANSGMGLSTAIELARQGARVIMVCRSRERGERALQEAAQQSGSREIRLMICDLGSLASIRGFAAEFKRSYDRLDVLINNAGVVSIKRELTADGFEMMLGVNHLGHFLLTNLLLGHLERSTQGRVIVLSSGAHKIGRIHWEDPTLSRGFSVWKGYAQSKLANLLFMTELAQRLKHTNITVNSVHPGAVSTGLGVNRNTGFGKSIHALLRPFFQTPAEGASTAIYLAASDEVLRTTGQYYYKKKVSPVSAAARDRQLAARFWAWSEQEVKLEESENYFA
ncbi:SDR family oxidoreductase [Paenibacillus sp. FJAT-26967]|uniref:SDR family oxidoreductase n=1 Tax=Paenibacillus sp. FJAT-26967 TaxID=1729690 RepID=UPI000839687D|nr:SDR family oxidoreductase [Paenibacillus sp. FJAT-26967]